MGWASQMLQTWRVSMVCNYVFERLFDSMDFTLQGGRVHAAVLRVCCLAQQWAISDLHRYLSHEGMTVLWDGRCVTNPCWPRRYPCLPVMGVSGPPSPGTRGGLTPGTTEGRENASLVSSSSWWELKRVMQDVPYTWGTIRWVRVPPSSQVTITPGGEGSAPSSTEHRARSVQVLAIPFWLSR